MRFVLLNTSILTSHGTFNYVPEKLDKIKRMLFETNEFVNNEILSAIGHESTAQILTDLLGFDVPVNRIQYKQTTSDLAIVFKLNGRPPEGKILSRNEIEEIGYEFGILKMLENENVQN